MKRPFLPVAVFMLLALWPMRMMQTTIDGAGFETRGFKSAVLQAEFPVTEKQVYDLYGAEYTGARAERTEKMRLAHRYDTLFLCLYGLFLLTFAFQGFRLTRLWHFMLMMLLAVAAAAADVVENGAIIAITQVVDEQGAGLSGWLNRLAFFTWMKWLSLALYFGMLTRFFWQLATWSAWPAWLGKVLGWACLAGCAVSFGAFITRSAVWENRMALAVTLMFGGLFLFSLLFRRKTA